ncbi:MAG: serine--tRNA ligase [Acidimicrobiia bacterium]|nr:serine--tRNA ligase [Acidimicrobiia bacterium]MDH3469868.1 serine--tRNA ligase [Acidimicrobiia bacterium]
MIDPVILRQDPDAFKAHLARRHLETDVAALVELDGARRKARTEAEELRSQQKSSGKEIARLDGADKEAAIAAAAKLSDQYKALSDEADELDARFHALWIGIPNLTHDSVPDGAGEDENVEISKWGDPPQFDFEVKDHIDLGEALGVIDVERGAKVSGARFAYLKGNLALMEFALVRFALDKLSAEGFTPVVPPVLVREEALFGTGFFPEAREQVYAIPEDELFLAGTAEIPLAAMHADEIFDAASLPVRYVGFSTCFRREAGTYGKDTRGIFRVHQFDKVEMFSFVDPAASWDEHDFLLSQEEALVQALGLPYRVVNVCVGDLGAPAAKKYDIEAWFPGQDRYRELTSCSNTTDFQARRLKARFKGENGTALVHTLNGTVFAIGRTLVAIMENYQRADGTIAVPEALVPYTGFEVIS